MTLNEWANAALAHQFGNYIDEDGAYQGQCWDLSANYGRLVVGCPSMPTVTGGAEGLYTRFANPMPQFFDKVANNPNDANQLPPAGAVMVYGPTSGNPYGHTEVVMGANSSGVDVIYQDGFNPTQGPLRKFRKWGSLPTLGWLVPKKDVNAANLQPYQRIVADGGVNRRSDPSVNQNAIETFPKGDVLDFGGWIYGQTVDNNNIWFKGRYSDTYFWSGAFTDTGNHDLADLNPVAPPPVVNPGQRVVGDGGLNVRTDPSTLAQIIKVLPTGTAVTVTGFTTKGANVSGNSTWFKIPDGWVWSGGLTDGGTGGIPDVTPADPTPTDPAPAPVYPAPTKDAAVTAVYNKKHPIGPDYAPADLVSVGNGQTLRKEAADSAALMAAAALKEGVTLTPGSGYRSYATQTTLYNNYVKQDGQAKADTYSARPGFSEHQTGLTMDFTPIDDSFKDGSASKWLIANAHKYGWILRYPEADVAVTGYMYEPWHWRYIGVTDATDMHVKGERTLEQYYGVAGGLYPDQDPKPTPDPDPTPTPDPDPTPTPTPEPTPADKNATVEAMKVVGRNGILGAVSAVITALGNWALLQIAGLHLPSEVLVSVGGLVYAALLALDKWIHDNAKTKLKGLVGF